ncbi:ABC transporter substrate-binding protein [Solirubrobacter phytolaccae]|uniref:ABC transporter substrate-binding protein n=1 Tax=Solirubrobacter phytolaccae TaxID=1404360 RepID=A0A9X3N7N8_9ACTN|nr:ABC transporter substrate-binding protein [Solirubrobacter phytolaccae]MDA0179782.1 ABC transporter substrate-binding protein [Solirubrobacter phytolaccae]
MPSSVARLAVAALSLAALITFSACGSDAERPTASAATATPSGTFPATVEHKYGTTTVKQAPQRVVVVGIREQDALLALGTAPVATTEWYGEDPGALESWAKAKLGSAPLPTVLPSSDGIEIERVAAQRPDLIVGIDTAMTDKEYAQLSRLAPTIAPPAGTVDYGASWQQDLQLVGDALGKRAEADKLQAQVEDQIEQTAAEHPQWKGKTAINATLSDGSFYVYGPKTANTQLFAQLGFAFPPALRDVGGGDDFGGTVSNERADLLDVDLILWDHHDAKDRAAIGKTPVYADLAVHEQGREVFEQESSPLYDALSKTSVLSVPVALKLLTPRFDAALDGDPSTSSD